MKNRTKEQQRLDAQRNGREDWRLWGPYLSERAWGTVREDYSPDGKAWEYFTAMIRPAQVLTAGMKTVWAVFVIPGSACAWPWDSGMDAILSSKNGCSA